MVNVGMYPGTLSTHNHYKQWSFDEYSSANYCVTNDVYYYICFKLSYDKYNTRLLTMTEWVFEQWIIIIACAWYCFRWYKVRADFLLMYNGSLC